MAYQEAQRGRGTVLKSKGYDVMWLGNKYRCSVCNKLGGTDGYCKDHRPQPNRTVDRVLPIEDQHGRVYHKLRDNYMEGWGHVKTTDTLFTDKFDIVSDTYPSERRR